MLFLEGKSGLERLAAMRSFSRRGNRKKSTQPCCHFCVWPNDIKPGLKIRVLRSDGSKFDIFHSSHHKYLQRRLGERYDSEHLHASPKHSGGSVINWGSTSASGVGGLVKTHESNYECSKAPSDFYWKVSDWQQSNFSLQLQNH